MIAMLVCSVSAIPTIAPAPNGCGNGISCAPLQTCMSNATGAGLLYACSPLPRAVRCMDARFSCPANTACAENSQCVAADGTVVGDAVVNADAHQVAEMRDFGAGMTPTSFSICGAITGTFRLPNFCTCKDAKFGGELGCTIGLQTYITIGASFEIGIADVGARAELSGDISRFIISTRLAIGVCARVGVGPFSKQICNPSALPWLPVPVMNGPRYDFSRFC